MRITQNPVSRHIDFRYGIANITSRRHRIRFLNSESRKGLRGMAGPESVQTEWYKHRGKQVTIDDGKIVIFIAPGPLVL